MLTGSGLTQGLLQYDLICSNRIRIIEGKKKKKKRRKFNTLIDILKLLT